MLEIHSNTTPNSQKISIFLEETGLEHRRIKYDIMKGEHLTAEYKKINPNNKLPAIVDLDPADGGAPITVFETGAILTYLADKTGKFLSSDARERSATFQWLIWQVAGLGPMTGQAAHFVRYAPEGNDYGIQRYVKETLRLLRVMEYRLRASAYLAGPDYTIADIACWPWVHTADIVDIDIKELPALHAWWQKIHDRPAVQTTLAGAGRIPPEMLKKRMTLTPEQWSANFGDRMHAAAILD